MRRFMPPKNQLLADRLIKLLNELEMRIINTHTGAQSLIVTAASANAKWENPEFVKSRIMYGLDCNDEKIKIKKENGTILIELLFEEPNIVQVHECLAATAQLGSADAIQICLGITDQEQPFFLDFDYHNHLFICGMQGSGKSYLLRFILDSLLYNYNSSIEIAVIDLRRNMLNRYAKNRFFSFVKKEHEVKQYIDSLIHEIQRRNALFDESGAANITAYNEKARQKLRHIFVCIDLFELLTPSAQKALAAQIMALTEFAGDFGVHFLLCMQYPNAKLFPAGQRKKRFNNICLRYGESRAEQSVIGKIDKKYRINGRKARLRLADIENEGGNIVNLMLPTISN